MALPRHSDTEFDRGAAAGYHTEDGGYAAGGRIGYVQTGIERRLVGDTADMVSVVPESPGERSVRLLSKSAGYVSLLAGYGVIILAFALWT